MTTTSDDMFAGLDAATTPTPRRTARSLARKAKTETTSAPSGDANAEMSAQLAALVDDHAAVSAEIDAAQRSAFDSIDGSRFVHTAGQGAMPMADVVRVLGLAGVPTTALSRWTTDYLTALARRHGAVVGDVPVSVITDVDLTDKGVVLTLTTTSLVASRIAPAVARAVASAMREATGGVAWRARVGEDGHTVRLASQVVYDSRAAAAKRLVLAASPRMAALGDPARGRGAWKPIARKAGLVEETVTKEKVYDHAAGKHIDLPRTKITASWPVGFVLGDGERAGLRFTTPPAVTLDR